MNQQGRSMIEMLGVLAIIGVLSVGGIAGYSKAMQKYRTNKTLEQITQVINGVRTLYAHQKSYNGINASVLKKAKILPESAFDGSTSTNARNPFGGELYIYSSSNSVVNAVTLQLDNIPEDACIDLASQDWGDSSGGLIAYAVNRSTWSEPDAIAGGYQGNNGDGAVQYYKNGVMPMDTIIKACSRGGNNYLTYEFR